MRIFFALVITVLTVGSAFAQGAVPRYGEPDKEKTFQQKQEEREAERAYKRSLDNIPDKGVPTDPWGAVRSDTPPKPATNAAPKKSKTSGAAKAPQ
jgi:hypothetical protein